ncbi:MAG: PDZ domain-containing protein [Acidobacteriota bacterium]
MKTRTMLNAILAVALAGPVVVPAAAQPADEKTPTAVDEKAREQSLRDAERQMRDAERQMRDAQRRLQEAAHKMAETQGRQAREQARAYSVYFGRKARLGMVVETQADPKTDAVGAVLTAVTPGGPADEAGLRAGDIITKIDGKPLTAPRSDAEADESSPGLALIEAAGDLEDGQKVNVEYRRGNEARSVTLTARSLGAGVFKWMDEPDVHVEIPEGMEDLTGEVERDVNLKVLRIPGGWLDMELATLDPDLAEYFGTKDGILVVRAPRDGSLQLKSGDVIVKIGDREPSSPAQALRILRSYEPGDKLTLDVVRKKQRMALAVQMPERRAGHWSTPPGAPPPPAPPKPPKPPKAPAPPASPVPPSETL